MLDEKVDCRREESFSKPFAAETAVDVTSRAIQLRGGYGYTEEYPVEHYYRDVRPFTMAEAAVEIRKLILGSDILNIFVIK